MSFVRKAAFEHFWQTSADTRKPLAQKQVEPIRARVVGALESNPSIIVEKVHYTSHPEAQMEIVCTWVGLNASEKDAEAAVREFWNEEIVGAEKEVALFEPEDDLFYFRFAADMPDERFFTGRILIRI